MEAQTDPATAESRRQAVAETDEAPRADGASAATVLLLAAWVGLIAGFLDLGFVVLKAKLADDFYRLGDAFPWIIPAGVTVLVVLPSIALAAIALPRRKGIPLGLAVWLPSFIGALDVCARLPMAFWGSALLSAGLATQSARLAVRWGGFPRLARRTTPLLAGSVLALALATTGVRAWAEWRASAGLSTPPPSAPNVLLIVWDTVRAESLGLHGYRRPTTPNLERLAERGVWFRHAFATSSWTLPSHASLFTGRWPHETSAGWKTPLDDAHPTLAGRLATIGYDTAGFVANLEYCGRETGLARGFAHYEDYPLTVWEIFTRYLGLGRGADPFTLAFLANKLGWSGRALPASMEHAKSSSDVNGAFLRWLSWQRPRDRPFFAYLNYNDAHTPYEVPNDPAPGFGSRPASWHDRLVLHEWNKLDKLKLPYTTVTMANDLYDDAIAHLDRQLGALLDELSRRGVLDDTVVVVTSDHGEHLGDHGLFFHGCSLYRQLVEVPLVVVAPKRVTAGLSVSEPVSLRDLSATVLGLTGSNPDAAFPGRSLARYWAEGNDKPPPKYEPLLMETEKPPLLTNQGREPVARGPMRALVAGGMHYIRSGDGTEELYALGADPEERTDLANHPNARQALDGFRGALRSLLRSGPTLGP